MIYTVTFNPNGGTVNLETKQVEYDVNDHKHVFEKISPLLSEEEREWLYQVTAPLDLKKTC